MKNLFFTLLLSVVSAYVMAQPTMPDHIKNRLPQGTIVHENIAYSSDDNVKHLLDLYLPFDGMGDLPVVIFIHGGGWISNDKYADMGYMMNTMAAMLNNGFAVASIDYRFAQDAVFPLILQDCNEGVSYLYDHAEEYNLDFENVALMGFSAGGHLASLMGTSQNNEVHDFYVDRTYRPFQYKAVVDYYGPTDLVLLPGNEDPDSPEATLIGAEPLLHPDLAKVASPITYLDKNDPPFIIYHGEKDNILSNKQSKLFSAWLTHFGVDNKITIVKDAPHFGPMYDVPEIREEVIDFLNKHLK